MCILRIKLSNRRTIAGGLVFEGRVRDLPALGIGRLGCEAAGMDVIVLDDDTSASEPEAPSTYIQNTSACRDPSRETSGRAAEEPAESQSTPGFSNSTAYMDAVRSALAMAAALDKKPKSRTTNKSKQPRKQAAPPPPRPFSSQTAESYKSPPAAAGVAASKSRAWVKKRERPRSVPFKTHAVTQQHEHVSFKTHAAVQPRDYAPFQPHQAEYSRAPERKRAAVPIDVTSSTSASSSGSSSSLSSDSESGDSSSSLSATPGPLVDSLMKRKLKLASPKRPHKSYLPSQESKSVQQKRQMFKSIRLDRPRAVEDLMLKRFQLNNSDLRMSQDSVPARQERRPPPPPPNSYAMPKSDRAPLVARKQLMSDCNPHWMGKNAMSSLKPAASLSSESKRLENKEKVFARLKKSSSTPKIEIPSRKNFVVLSSSSSESESAASISSDDHRNGRAKRVRKTPFHTDHVALDEMQAQERELARFQAQKKQDLEGATPSLKTPRPKPAHRAPEPRLRATDEHDAVIELDSDVDMSDEATVNIKLCVIRRHFVEFILMKRLRIFCLLILLNASYHMLSNLTTV